ncbi:uncharacterized protein P174DRAFT_421447 [Aspergillus novofumigatus IBT 16806]|uniref:Uncharacterized protein n=1 Tax=Aspergillus novofumigatus (strain IBT 16806) TaxID=1392255 RepID=A0A2I1C439_ASPN1|nr:uncharacterized protein P174DRAFT_421447 [Aspergillus novofumigatus IBT 16806]PKX92378.1 hypothetical protein P174DRAFT_421447 [Aspergillus novofumigatus IBT 16806]
MWDYTDASLWAHAQAFSDFMKPEKYDGAAMMGVFLDYVRRTRRFDAFTAIPNLGGVAELTTVDDVVEQFGADIPSNLQRGFQLAFSFNNPNATVYMELIKISEKGLSKVANVEGIFVEFLSLYMFQS